MTAVRVIRSFTGDEPTLCLQKTMEFEGIPRIHDRILVQEEAPERPGYLLQVANITFKPYAGFQLGWVKTLIDIFTEPEPADRADLAKARGWKEADSSSLLLLSDT